MATVEERVARGAARLDEAAPGWHENINVQTLNIASGSNCALGQTYGTYAQGINVLGIQGGGSDLGFNAQGGEFNALTAEWRRLIESRLEAQVQAWAEEAIPYRTFRRQPVGV